MLLTKVMKSYIVTTMRTRKKNREHIKDYVMGVKVHRQLLADIDAERLREGISRSTVVRRILMLHYAKLRKSSVNT